MKKLPIIIKKLSVM